MKSGLGKGLDALFAVYEQTEKVDNLTKNAEKTEKIEHFSDNMVDSVVEISVGMIDPDKNQPRKNFDDEALKELADSIKIHGVIQPIVVKKIDDRYSIIAGERRWRACKIAGLKQIPCIVRNYTQSQIREISIVENLQREDLNPIECATAIKQLMDEYKWTQEEVSDRIGKSRSVVANTVRLLNLEPEVIEMIKQGKLSAGHARSLVVINNRDAQIKLAKQVSQRKLTVRDLEIATKTQKTSGVRKIEEQSSELKEFVRFMQKKFATKVSLIGNDHRGRIYIDYFNKDDLERIYEIINKIK